MKTVHYIALILVIIGALNWGLVGLFRFNLVAAMFGEMSSLSRIVYVVVGAAGVLLAVTSASLQTANGRLGHRAHPVQ